MPGAVYTLFRNAILGEQQVVCLYGGRLRELCPHIIGTNKRSEEVVLAWQFAGESSGPLPQWRCLKLAGVSKARPRSGRWHEGSSHLRQRHRPRHQRSRPQTALKRRCAGRAPRDRETISTRH